MFEIKMAYKNSRIHLKLNQKVNIIVDDNVTGKMTAIKMLYNRSYRPKIKLQDDSYSIQHFRSSELVTKYGLQYIFNGKYIVIADDSDMIFEDWVYDIINSGNSYYFILIIRKYIHNLKFDIESLWQFKEINNITYNVPFVV